MATHSRQLPRNSTIDIFHHGEVRGEEDVEIALMNERRRDLDVSSLIPSLYDGSVQAGDCIGWGELVEVGEDEAVCREVCGEDVEELEEACWDIFWSSQVGG